MNKSILFTAVSISLSLMASVSYAQMVESVSDSSPETDVTSVSADEQRLIEKISFNGNKQIKSDVIRNYLRGFIGQSLDENQIRAIAVQINDFYKEQKIPAVVSYYTVAGSRPVTSNVFIKITEGSAIKNTVTVASRTTPRGVPILPNQGANKVKLSTANGTDWAADYDNRDQRFSLSTNTSSKDGLTLISNYGILLSPNFALGVNLSYGPAYTEWLLTSAADLPANVRLRLTAGQLKRQDSYTFRNLDNDKATVTQNMYLASIGKSFENSFLNDINLKFYGAEAVSSDTKAKLYTAEGDFNGVASYLLKEDPRTLALGKMTGAQLGVNLALSSKVNFSLSGGQETVDYKYVDGTFDKTTAAAGQAKLSAVFDNCWAADLAYQTSSAAKSKVEASLGKAGLTFVASQTQSGVEGQADDARFGVTYTLVGDRSEKVGCKRFAKTAYAKNPLLDAVVTRPSELPTSVFAKVDQTAKLKTRIAVTKAGQGVTGMNLDNNGILFITISGVTGKGDQGVKLNGGLFDNPAVTVVAGGVRVDLEKLPAVSAATDIYTADLKTEGVNKTLTMQVGNVSS